MEITGKIIAVLPAQGGVRVTNGNLRIMSLRHMTRIQRNAVSVFSVKRRLISLIFSWGKK